LSLKKLTIFDTTLRDGEQGEGISFTVKDKLKITQLLDTLGVHYIEGGWPGSNPKAVDYFKGVQELSLTHAKVAAFGSTRRAGKTVETDLSIQALIHAETPVVVIFGKSWDFHVTHALKIELPENLALIADSVRYLKANNKEVFYDAEHFFDGFKHNPKYALETLSAAQSEGADILCLCDTNGGCLPSEIYDMVTAIKKAFPKTTIGIHTHNDAGMAVANSIAAVDAGATHIQGTLNGYGERCGNANLSTLIPTLVLKMGIDCIPKDKLVHLASVSHRLDEIANVTHNHFLPYVGKSAFAHKGGVHVSAILKHPETYEHVNPELVGNSQRVLISELSGLSNLIHKTKEMGIDIDPKNEKLKTALDEIKSKEHAGYQYEEAEASLELLLRRILFDQKSVFDLISYKVVNAQRDSETCEIESILKLKLGAHVAHIAADGNGPVSALDHALRKALLPHFPEIDSVRLVDYKVRVLNSKDGTNAKVKVLIECKDHEHIWGTIGVSENIIEASWLALADCYEYKLLVLDPSKK